MPRLTQEETADKQRVLFGFLDENKDKFYEKDKNGVYLLVNSNQNRARIRNEFNEFIKKPEFKSKPYMRFSVQNFNQLHLIYRNLSGIYLMSPREYEAAKKHSEYMKKYYSESSEESSEDGKSPEAASNSQK
jgi:hypothetical protein